MKKKKKKKYNAKCRMLIEIYRGGGGAEVVSISFFFIPAKSKPK